MVDSDSNRGSGEPGDGSAVDQAPDAQAAPAGGPPAATDAERLKALEEEVARLKDQNLRLMAETRNIQQRTQRDMSEALRYAEANFARELLLVLDDLGRTRDAVEKGEDVAAIGEGIRIVLEHFFKLLNSRGIVPIEALGEPFDPHLHEAILQQPSDQYPAGVVMQEVAPGYTMHDRVLRPTRVIVSSGPGPSEANPEEAEEIE
jgi:molecular chaperone GrpE